MSPQRRKGRGGGAGKVSAPPPSTSAPLAIDSPSLVPIKPSRQRGKTLASILPASCKSSSAPISTSFPTKPKFKDRSRSITTASASSCDTLLSAAGLCDARASSQTGKFVQRTGRPSLSSSHGISRSRKTSISTNHDRASIIGSAFAQAQAHKCTLSKECRKTSMPSVLSQDSSHMGISRRCRSQSYRSLLQKEDLGEGLRWSTVSLPKSISNIEDVDEKFLSDGSSVKLWFTALSKKHSSNGLSYASSPDRRHSMGSSVMSIATSLHSGYEEALDDDVDIVRISDEYKEQRDITSDVISRGMMAWQNDMDACTCQRSKFLVESGKRCMGSSSYGILRHSLETKEDQTFSNAHDQLNERRSSLSSSISSGDIIHLKEDTIEGQQIHDGKPNYSISLHQRLALLEGRVSQIASELRKTKEMLDNNTPSSSIALLSDIQGKISSLEQAMTTRPHDKHLINQQNALMEEDLCKAYVKYCPDHSDSGGEFCKPSVTEQPHENASPHVSLLASRKNDRLESDQQELEDRLFPHRKLLKSRLSLHERAMESRAALHSKLEEAVPQSLSAEGVHVSSLLQLDTGNERTFPHLIGSELDSCTCSAKKQSVTENDAEPHPLGEFTSNRINLCHFDRNFLTGGPTLGSGDKYLSIDSDAIRASFEVHNRKLKESYHEKMQYASGQEASSLANVRTQEASQSESALKFLECDESLQLETLDTQENLEPDDEVEVDSDELQAQQLRPVGQRVATAGWYACGGEAIVLVHDDGCCSFFDVVNMEEKAVYKCPEGYPAISWNDCWLIRAAGSDGQPNKYVVAATSGTVLDAGFCSWDFQTRETAAHHSEEHFTWLDLNASAQSSPIGKSPEFQTSATLCCSTSTETVSHLSGSSGTKAGFGFPSANIFRSSVCNESAQWWYRPCGPLMASAGSSLQQLALYDIRDSETIMTWDTKQPVLSLDYSSPLQWRNRGKIALAEEQAISLWDVNALDAQCLHSINLPGKRICAFYVHNADAEFSGGIRQRLSSSDMEAFDGICCTQNDINVLDFRVPGGIGLCLPATKQVMQSVFAFGDTILVGGMHGASNKCEMQQWSARMGRPVCAYAFRPSSSHYAHLSLTQVWGSSSAVMAVNGNGLHIFKGYKEIADGQCGFSEEEKEVSEMHDLVNPSFDYANSRILLISRDRPASCCYWPL